MPHVPTTCAVRAHLDRRPVASGIAGLAGGALLLLSTTPLRAQHAHSDASHEHAPLHFSHPLVAESPSPDKKARLDYSFLDIEEGPESATRNVVRFEAEYAFHPSFSVEVRAPYVFLEPEGGPGESRLADVEVGLKFANFAFADRGLLLGYGLELGLPTGDDAVGIGSDNILEVEPFLNVAYRRRGLELVGFAKFGIPTNQSAAQEIETELGYNLSALYHVSAQIQALVELDGESVLSGEESGQAVLHASPGVKILPWPGRGWAVGLSAGLPVTDRSEFETRILVSVFRHF